MRILTLLFCVLLMSQSSTEKVFEGELVYYHNIKMNNKTYAESRKYFDTLKVTYKDKNYIKLTNKKEFEKILFIDSLEKLYVIYKDNFSKSKKISMIEDNLNFGKLYNRKNSHFGSIISSSKSDTVLNFNNKKYQLKKLFVERQYGNETYIYSTTDNFKLADNRNILRNIGEQIHPKEIADELNNSILYYYKSKVKSADLYEEYRLIEIRNHTLKNTTFEIPKHKDEKGFKRENKKKGRFKYYELVK